MGYIYGEDWTFVCISVGPVQSGCHAFLGALGSMLPVVIMTCGISKGHTKMGRVKIRKLTTCLTYVPPLLFQNVQKGRDSKKGADKISFNRDLNKW